MIFDILKDVILLGSGRGRLEREVKGLRNAIDLDIIIPWADDELGLLSLQLEHKTKKSFFNTIVSGYFKTIYAESVIGYAYKDVYTGTKRGLILAKSHQHEYVYRLTKGVAELYIDGDAIGVIDYRGRLLSNRRNRVLGMIEQSSGNTAEVVVAGNRIGSFNKPTKDAALHERAVQLFKQIDNSHKQIAVSLVIFEILKRNV